jgi:hypothetical protein
MSNFNKSNRFNLTRNSNIDWKEDTVLFMPGVFQFVCLETNRASFDQALFTLICMRQILHNLDQGCLNSDIFCDDQLLLDYEKYGINNFFIDIIGCEHEYSNEQFRREVLQQAKNNWPGELYKTKD